MTAFLPLVGYALRTARPRHGWVALLPTALVVVLALLARRGDGTAESEFVVVVGIAVCTVLMPLTCLVVGDAVLGAEIRSGTLSFTWLSPVPPAAIVLARWAGGWLLVGAALLPAVVVGALVAGAPGALLPTLAAVALGSAAYLAVFMLLGAALRRALAWSLGFVVVVERFLGAALPAIAGLTPSWLSLGLLTGWTDGPSVDVPTGAGAGIRLGVLSGVALLLTARRVARPRLAAGDD